MKYRSVQVVRRGGPEALQIIENDLRPPAPTEVRLRVLACPVVQDDVAVRYGRRPLAKKPPFIPGYSVIGVVDAVGEQVTNVAPGDRAAALVNFGGYAEYLYWEAEALAGVPPGLDPIRAAPLILNYLVAYQTLHRVAQVRPGETALIIGAGGGCGTALLQLGRLAGLRLYGLASPANHPVLESAGAAALDYHDPAWPQALLRLVPGGLDYVFNGMDEAYFGPGLSVLRRGGVLVHFGGPTGTWRLLVLVARLIANNLAPNGKTIKGYGTHREDLAVMKADWSSLMALLAAGEIDPIIAATFPLMEARRANEAYERGGFCGCIVLAAPELLPRG